MNACGELRRELTFSLLKTAALLGVAALLICAALPKLSGDYLSMFGLESRTVVWLVMQLHLMFAAFVLGVPIFALIVEIVGAATRDDRYDRLARNFTQLFALAVMATAIAGVVGLGALVFLYPKVMNFLGSIFAPTYLPYAATIMLNGILLILYYATWQRMTGRLKWLHVGIGALLNISGTALMCIANAWATFMMSPAGVTEAGRLVSLSQAIQNPLWWPINIHRFVANIAFGGALAAAYAAIRFLLTRSKEERAYYDWMGYVGSFVAMWALIPLPFAGYYLGTEMYAYSAQMGTNLMGGAFSWLFIIQAVLIGVLFIGANYYMWLGLGRIPGGHRYYKFVLTMEILIFVSMAVWMTPHTLVASLAEARRMGGAHHPLLGVLGVMSAKNTAMNLVLLTTFLSFVLYRRANKQRQVPRPSGGVRAPIFIAVLSLFPILYCGVNGYVSAGAKAESRMPELIHETQALRERLAQTDQKIGAVLQELQELDRKESELGQLAQIPGLHHAAGYRLLAGVFAMFLGLALLDLFVMRGRIGDLLQWTIVSTAAAIVVYFGVKGYFVPADVRIGYSVYQVMAVLYAMLVVTALDLHLSFEARSLGAIRWGEMPPRSQYVLVLLAVTFTLTIALMGFVRSGIRESWHVYGMVRDLSPSAYTPTMGYGAQIVAAATLLFLGLLFLLFRYGMRNQRA